jgi:WD40 repeat protein
MNANELNVPCLVTLVGSSTCVAFHPTAPLLATGSDDMTVKLWQLSDNSALTCVATLTGHDGQVYSVAFDPTGTLLATGSEDSTAKLWRLSADGATFVATCVATLGGHGRQVYSVAFHPTARLLATGSEDSAAKLWRLSADGATCVATLEGHGVPVYSVAFHPTAPILATGSRDGTAKLWRLSADGATCVATLNVDRSDEFASLGFDPTGTVLATAGHNGTKLWDCRQFQRKNVTDDFGAMKRKLVKKLVGDDYSSMQHAILNRVARGNGESWLGVDPVTATHVNAHLNQLYLRNYGNVPFNPKTVHLKRLLNQSSDSEKTEGGSMVRPRSKAKSKMMKRKRTTLKRKSHK